jgi:hypothetical protein
MTGGEAQAGKIAVERRFMVQRITVSDPSGED